jgi:TRAP-type C4-dicarboxylate transport system permease small subunit
MKKPNGVSAVLRDADLYLACLSLAVLIAVTVSGVFARYVANRPFGWMEEVQLWCFVWTVFPGAAAVARHGGHIAIDAFVGLFPKALRKMARSISHGVTILVMGFFLWNACMLVAQMHRTARVTSILAIPNYIIYGVVPLACLVILLVSLHSLFRPREEAGAVETAIREAENV